MVSSPPLQESSSSPLIYFAPVGEGGLAKYAVFQASALADVGVEVVVLGSSHIERELRIQAPSIEFVALDEVPANGGKFARAVAWIRSLRSQASQLRKLVQDCGSNQVLMTCFAEYFSPFWIGPLKGLRKKGVRVGTVVHDPVRDFRIGPNWWHQLCISSTYSLIDVAFVHSDVVLETGWPKRAVKTCQIPHGPYEVPVIKREDTQTAARDALRIPKNAKLLLSFGHIRDGKNLDLLISAIKEVPELHLLVVGREQSSSQRSVPFYQNLARQHEVDNRCHWVNEFVSDETVSKYFLAADYLALVYSADFRSASGVLSLASQFELPILGSSGHGPLRDSILQYHLGVFVAPDSSKALISGLNQLLNGTADARWQCYKTDHSWRANAKAIVGALGD